MKTKLIETEEYLLLIDEEGEIFQMNYYLDDDHYTIAKATLSLDQYEGCTKIIAYYPLTKEAKELDLPLLPNPFQEEINIKKLSKLKSIEYLGREDKSLKEEKTIFDYREGFEAGYKAAQSKQFSLEDMKKAIEIAQTPIESGIGNYLPNINEVLESLSTQQLSKEFIPEIEYYYEKYKDTWFATSESNYTITKRDWGDSKVKTELKIITNSEGKQELVGTYQY